jgi:hypothetical protein
VTQVPELTDVDTFDSANRVAELAPGSGFAALMGVYDSGPATVTRLP